MELMAVFTGIRASSYDAAVIITEDAHGLTFQWGLEHPFTAYVEIIAIDQGDHGCLLDIADPMDSMDNYAPHMQFRAFLDGYRFIVGVCRK